MSSLDKNQPLADRVRPKKLENFFGQDDIIGSKSFLRQAIDGDKVPAMIFWGPPGSGKTTLAYIIAQETKADFIQLSAVSSGLKQLREIIERSRQNQRLQIKTILFIDEIHRWNKAQQDALLPHVENGLITLIGATTENPSFEVNSALLSRIKVVVLSRLEKADIEKIIKQAAFDDERGLGLKIEQLKEKIISLIAGLANGDARAGLNILELSAQHSSYITEETVRTVLPKGSLYYDQADEHYNLISALHKSLLGHDADAALYWLARMLEGGEDPLYIARRLVRFASEDIGIVNNNALLVANSAFTACERLGLPECSVNLAQCVVYLAKSKKSIAIYQAYSRARQDAVRHGNLPVPLHLRNAPTELMKNLNYGRDYKYTPLENSKDQRYLPKELEDKRYLSDN